MTATSRDALTRLWPLFGLRLATPRLILRPICDDDLAELVDLVLAGIHPADRMPFLTPWTDAPRAELIANTLRYHWRIRAESEPDDWSVQFAVRSRGALLGLQEITARNFAVTRVVASGSWLGRVHQGQGYGTEMRAAVLDFAFDHLKATRATSAAFTDNPASQAVSRKLGYVPDGSDVVQRRPGEAAVDQRLLLIPETFNKPGWSVQVAGFEACRTSFGV
ncbi:Protein N-acetyltransferase, RimJ/RimL family [Nakamurella panacisegetis]|uniref:Protein N-acetyltransferase, RimJ/RimL family n=1 Tax=Nakamurella panacisegetis TaxID=1090615 RepID=A0A1H0K2K9_9ACTN|nr:GNAT family protein [Nakamurella panacisegetis]SDO50104.1 Protein N-acetyltransferase, RimJ/RimL family [Nakamurella panacisegetis]